MKAEPIHITRLLDSYLLNCAEISRVANVDKWKFYELRTKGIDCFTKQDHERIAEALGPLGIVIDWT